MLSVLVQRRKSSFQHCDIFFHRDRDATCLEQFSFLDLYLQRYHGFQTDSKSSFVLCSILPPLLSSILPPFEIFKWSYMTRICDQHSAPTATPGSSSGHQLSNLLYCRVRSRKPGTPLSVNPHDLDCVSRSTICRTHCLPSLMTDCRTSLLLFVTILTSLFSPSSLGIHGLLP